MAPPLSRTPVAKFITHVNSRMLVRCSLPRLTTQEALPHSNPALACAALMQLARGSAAAACRPHPPHTQAPPSHPSILPWQARRPLEHPHAQTAVFGLAEFPVPNTPGQPPPPHPTLNPNPTCALPGRAGATLSSRCSGAAWQRSARRGTGGATRSSPTSAPTPTCRCCRCVSVHVCLRSCARTYVCCWWWGGVCGRRYALVACICTGRLPAAAAGGGRAGGWGEGSWEWGSVGVKVDECVGGWWRARGWGQTWLCLQQLRCTAYKLLWLNAAALMMPTKLAFPAHTPTPKTQPQPSPTRLQHSQSITPRPCVSNWSAPPGAPTPGSTSPSCWFRGSSASASRAPCTA